jgi:Sensors of blue-light using FAD
MGAPERISGQAVARGGNLAMTGPVTSPGMSFLAEARAGALERLVYVSRAAPCIDIPEVYAIIRRAHADNTSHGITGALVFLDGWFAQVLEGPACILDARLARIRRDLRHEGLQLRQRERVHAPAFAGQPMALRTRACLDPRVLEAFGYRPGFPVDGFPADVLVEFVVQACHRRRPI